MADVARRARAERHVGRHRERRHPRCRSRPGKTSGTAQNPARRRVHDPAIVGNAVYVIDSPTAGSAASAPDSSSRSREAEQRSAARAVVGLALARELLDCSPWQPTSRPTVISSTKGAAPRPRGSRASHRLALRRALLSLLVRFLRGAGRTPVSSGSASQRLLLRRRHHLARIGTGHFVWPLLVAILAYMVLHALIRGLLHLLSRA